MFVNVLMTISYLLKYCGLFVFIALLLFNFLNTG